MLTELFQDADRFDAMTVPDFVRITLPATT